MKKGREEYIVLGIDPGSEDVGYSLGNGKEVLEWGTMRPLNFMIHWFWKPSSIPHRLAVERFDMRQFTSESQETVELIGAIRFFARYREIPMNEVNASAKNKYIRYVDRKITGHARDAEAIRLYDLDYNIW